MLKARYSYSLSLFAAFLFILFAYQNCGDVGGQGLLDSFSSTDPDQEGQNSFAQLKINSPSVANLYDRSLNVSGTCTVYGEYKPYYRHRVHWQVLEGNIVKADSRTASYDPSTCSESGTYNIDYQLSFTAQSNRDYFIKLELVPLNEFGGEILEGIQEAVADINADATIYPPSFSNEELSYNKWFESGDDYREIDIIDYVGPNFMPYTGISLKIDFTLDSNPQLLSSSNNKTSAFIDLLPEDAGGNLINIRIANGNVNSQKTSYIYLSNLSNRVEYSDNTSHFFEAGKSYSFYARLDVYNGMAFKFVKKSNNDAIERINLGVNASNFGYVKALLRLGLTNSSTYIVNNNIYSNVKVNSKVCGYNSNNNVDSQCFTYID